VNLRSSLALLAALALAWAAVRWTRRRFGRTHAGERFFRHPVAAPALAVLVFFATIAVAAPLVAPYDPIELQDMVGLTNRPPSPDHPLGTDALSRDLWSRIVFGSRVSLSIGAVAALLAVTAGAVVGAVAGYFRRWVDAILMRVVDVGLALPRIFLLILAVGVWGRLPIAVLIVLIAVTGWFGTSRLVRAEVLSLRERAFVDAARALGAGPSRIILRHVLPNVAAPIIISAALGIGNVLLLEAGLSFLGIGVAPPTPSWGRMIAEGSEWIAAAPWTTIWPGIAIALVVMSLNTIGDALRDAFDPRAEAS
jgi:peptide/nickel transport system permease protein